MRSPPRPRSQSRSRRAQTTPISLTLMTCTCKGRHKVKLGGNYGGTPGCKRYAKSHWKAQVPKPLVRAIARQLGDQWKLLGHIGKIAPEESRTSDQNKGAVIGSAFVVATPDSGSTRSVITSETALQIIKTNSRANPGLQLLDVAPYKIDLADGKFTNCFQKAIADITIITPKGKRTLKNVTMNVLPGPASPLLIGASEIKLLGAPSMWEILGTAISKGNGTQAKNESARSAAESLKEWRSRRKRS